MILPSGINKMTGLAAALNEMAFRNTMWWALGTPKTITRFRIIASARWRSKTRFRP